MKYNLCGTERASRLMPFLRIEPTGMKAATIHVPIYPPHPEGEALYKARVAADLTLREAAKLLDLRASDLSDLEWGRIKPDDFGEWRRWMAVIANHGGGR